MTLWDISKLNGVPTRDVDSAIKSKTFPACARVHRRTDSTPLVLTFQKQVPTFLNRRESLIILLVRAPEGYGLIGLPILSILNNNVLTVI